MTQSFFASRRPMRAALLAALVTSGVAAPNAARADANACTGIHASGQREMKAGRLKSASKQFTACGSDEACPEAVRADCMELFQSVERLIPTIIFSAVDQTGSDVTSLVKVYSGETLLVEGLDGRAIAVDPGQYHFRFELPWGESVTSDALVREGEKNRVVSVKVVDPNKVAAAAEESTPPDTGTSPLVPSPSEPPNRTPVGFWVASGIGVAALGTGTVFALMGRSKHSQLADCSPSCDPAREDDYDAMKRNYLIGDIALGAGLVSVGVAAVIYFTAGNPRTESTTAAIPRLDFAPARSGKGGTLLLSGTTF